MPPCLPGWAPAWGGMNLPLSPVYSREVPCSSVTGSGEGTNKDRIYQGVSQSYRHCHHPEHEAFQAVSCLATGLVSFYQKS